MAGASGLDSLAALVEDIPVEIGRKAGVQSTPTLCADACSEAERNLDHLVPAAKEPGSVLVAVGWAVVAVMVAAVAAAEQAEEPQAGSVPAVLRADAVA